MEDKAFQDLVYQLRSIKLTEKQTEVMKLAVAVKQRKDLEAKSHPNPELTIVIEDILAKHREEDMRDLLQTRQCLNNVNGWLISLFHLVQTVGILLTSFAAGTGRTSLVWGGVILNSLASLMQIYIKAHDASLKKMLADLKLIKKGRYEDQDTFAEDKGGKQVDVTHNHVDITHNQVDVTHKQVDVTHNHVDVTENQVDVTQ